MKNFVQKILDRTDIDEKILAEVGKLGDKAREELAKYSGRRVKKAAIVAGVSGLAIGAAIGIWLG
ncbi:MAG: hypothetical protein LBO03_04545 [Acidaminococcales bacterium]|jgi:hypothetical protein|nr:hypothetical protein [Acidaminococcales bacterium]